MSAGKREDRIRSVLADQERAAPAQRAAQRWDN
jgi:hypothetical protein